MKKTILFLSAVAFFSSCSKEEPVKEEFSTTEPLSVESVLDIDDGLGGGSWYSEIDLNSGYYKIEWFRSEENYPLMNLVIDTTWADVGEFLFNNGTMYTVYNGFIQILPSYIGYPYSLNHTFGASIQQSAPTAPKILYAGEAWVITPVAGGFELSSHVNYGLMGWQRRTMFLRAI